MKYTEGRWCPGFRRNGVCIVAEIRWGNSLASWKVIGGSLGFGDDGDAAVDNVLVVGYYVLEVCVRNPLAGRILRCIFLREGHTSALYSVLLYSPARK